MTNNEEHVLVILKWRPESISKREEWINYNGPSSAQNKRKTGDSLNFQKHHSCGFYLRGCDTVYKVLMEHTVPKQRDTGEFRYCCSI